MRREVEWVMMNCEWVLAWTKEIKGVVTLRVWQYASCNTCLSPSEERQRVRHVQSTDRNS